MVQQLAARYTMADAVEIRYMDAEGRAHETSDAVASGVFEFAGQKLKVKDGEASMTFAQFVAGKHSVPIWLHREGMKPIPGVPTFG